MITATKPRDAGREAQLAEYGVKAAVEWADNQQLVITLDLGQFDRLFGIANEEYERGYETGYALGCSAANREMGETAREMMHKWDALVRAGKRWSDMVKDGAA